MKSKTGWVLSVAVAGVVGFILVGCGTHDPAGSAAPAQASADETNSYVRDPIDIGDRIRIDLNPGTTVPLAPVETDIKGDGMINLPDIGRVEAAGRTPGELEKDIQAKYEPAYYTHMAVTVTPIVRYFYVYGQVGTGMNAKQFYTGPITVTQAIAAAGDFTPFANKKKVRLRRKSDGSTHYINCVKAINDPKLDLWVHPGDIIYVDRRIL